MAAPTTSASGANIVIDWVEPFDNGSPITEYEILIQKPDLTTYATTSDCDGTDPAIVAA